MSGKYLNTLIIFLFSPLSVRPEIDFNKIDDVCKVDRRSCLGKYNVANAVPLNPIGRTGLSGRGLLDFWGPNHSVEAIITRLLFKKEILLN